MSKEKKTSSIVEVIDVQKNIYGTLPDILKGVDLTDVLPPVKGVKCIIRINAYASLANALRRCILGECEVKALKMDINSFNEGILPEHTDAHVRRALVAERLSAIPISQDMEDKEYRVDFKNNSPFIRYLYSSELGIDVPPTFKIAEVFAPCHVSFSFGIKTVARHADAFLGSIILYKQEDIISGHYIHNNKFLRQDWFLRESVKLKNVIDDTIIFLTKEQETEARKLQEEHPKSTIVYTDDIESIRVNPQNYKCKKYLLGVKTYGNIDIINFWNIILDNLIKRCKYVVICIMENNPDLTIVKNNTECHVKMMGESVTIGELIKDEIINIGVKFVACRNIDPRIHGFELKLIHTEPEKLIQDCIDNIINKLETVKKELSKQLQSYI